MPIFSTSQITAISNLAYSKFGIHISEEKFSTLEIKIGRVLRDENLTDIDDLYQNLLSNNKEVIESFIHSITTSHTFFFREPSHLARLVSFISQNKQSEYLIWCAACSTGEEPYSIIMTLLEAGIRTFRVIATDLNKNVLERCNKGEYNLKRLEGVSPALLKRYFKQVDECTYKINPALRQFLSLKKLNLMDTFSFPRPVDYIFCRNVLIYFNEESRFKALGNVTANLKHGGNLFIGHAETLLSQPEDLIKVANSIYEKI